MVDESPAPPSLPALPPPGEPSTATVTVPGTSPGESNTHPQEITSVKTTGDDAPLAPSPVPPPPLPALPAVDDVAAAAATVAEASSAAPHKPSTAEVASSQKSSAAPAVAASSNKKRKSTSTSSPKRVSKTSLHFKSDIDPAKRDGHPHGILHATKVSSSSSGREEHAFAWIAEIVDDEDVRVAAHLSKYGFRATHMRFVPFSSKANWMARYPHAKPSVACNASGEISGRVPQWEEVGTGGVALKKKKSPKKNSSKNKKALPRLVSNGLLPNLERDELHRAIHAYFLWLHDELSELETNQAGRRQVSNAGVSVPGLKSLVAKLEGTFKVVQLEKERKGNARSLVIQSEKERRENEENTAGVDAGIVDLNGDDEMVMNLPLMADGSPMPQQQPQQQQPQQQQQEPKENSSEQQGKLTEVPFLEHALETELQRIVAAKLPNKSTNFASLKKTSATAEKKASWRQLDFDTMFQKLLDFKEENGHPSPPVKHPELGRWVSYLRLNKKILREKGLEWEHESRTEEDSKHTLSVAVVMPREGGEEAASSSSQEQKDPANFAICTTTDNSPRAGNENNNNNTTLTISRVARLDSIDFTWAVLPVRVTWEQRFEELRMFKEREGRFPSNKEGTIGNWLKGQRKLYTKRDANFLASRCAKLEEIGVPLRQRHYTALSWDDRFQQLVEFGRVNRHFRVPNPAPDNGDGRVMLEDQSSDAADAKRFYKFVQKIHTEYRGLQRGIPSTLLTEERIAQLRNIGFEFSVKNEKTIPQLDWSTRIQQLEAFLSEMGHLRVDPNYDKYSNLGGWAVEMSERHRSWQEGREYLSPDMVEKFAQLNAMGFNFDIFRSRRGERSWEDSFNLLLLYRQETGSCRVPHHYKADFRLGSWVAVQRKEYKLMVEGKPSRMTHEHIQRLESIGFEWVARRGD